MEWLRKKLRAWLGVDALKQQDDQHVVTLQQILSDIGCKPLMTPADTAAWRLGSIEAKLKSHSEQMWERWPIIEALQLEVGAIGAQLTAFMRETEAEALADTAELVELRKAFDDLKAFHDKHYDQYATSVGQLNHNTQVMQLWSEKINAWENGIAAMKRITQVVMDRRKRVRANQARERALADYNAKRAAGDAIEAHAKGNGKPQEPDAPDVPDEAQMHEDLSPLAEDAREKPEGD